MPVPPEVIEEVKHRYGLIGRSPLTQLTLHQGKLLAEELEVAGLRRHAQLEAVYVGGHDRAMNRTGSSARSYLPAPQNSRTSVRTVSRRLNVEGGTPFAVGVRRIVDDDPLLIAGLRRKVSRRMGPRLRGEMSARVR